MDDFITAIQQKDFVKVKRIFTEQMEIKKAEVIAERKLVIAQNVMIEGESPNTDDDDDDDSDDDDDDDDEDE